MKKNRRILKYKKSLEGHFEDYEVNRFDFFFSILDGYFFGIVENEPNCTVTVTVQFQLQSVYYILELWL